MNDKVGYLVLWEEPVGGLYVPYGIDVRENAPIDLLVAFEFSTTKTPAIFPTRRAALKAIRHSRMYYASIDDSDMENDMKCMKVVGASAA